MNIIATLSYDKNFENDVNQPSLVLMKELIRG